jgi:transcriptional regulator with XRE-family HTH domain
MSSRQSRQELARFLRTRRQRIAPSQVGLPHGRRRRTEGLRREEVAVLAGLSPTWYTYLEQARDIHPSQEVLDSLAAVLALTEDERLYMHQLAGHVPAPKPDPNLDQDVALARELVKIAGTTPYPLYVVDYMGGILAWNEAIPMWYTDWGTRTGLDRNIVYWLVTSDEARERILDWADDARDVVGRLRALTARYPHDRAFHELVTKLNEESADFRRWWANHEVRGQRLRLRRFQHRSGRVYTMRMAVVHPSDNPSMSLVFHLPASPADNL